MSYHCDCCGVRTSDGPNTHALVCPAEPVEAVRQRLALALELLDQVSEGERDIPCRFDHHGYCQEHLWFAIDPSCPWPRIKALLEASL